MAAGKSEGTMRIERVGRTCVGELLDRVGVLLRCIAPGYLGLYVWTLVIEEGGYYTTWVTGIGAGVLGFLVYALHTCALSRLFFRPLLMLSLLAREKHPWISSEQRKLAAHGSKMLLLELAVQRWRRRISDSLEIKAVQKGLDRRCRLGSFMYCSSYAMILMAGLAFCPLMQIERTELAWHMIAFGSALLLFAILSDYATMQTDLWAATTYPQGKTTKIKKKVTVKASKLKVKKRTSKTRKKTK